MAYLQSFPVPHSLDINDSNVAEKWNEWNEMCLHYSVAAKVNIEDGEVQVATLIHIINSVDKTKLSCNTLLTADRS